MDIQSEEYTVQRTAFELCSWINFKLQTLESEPNFDEDYFERKGKNVKKLLEEAIPTAKVALYLWRPFREISVTCLASNEAYCCKPWRYTMRYATSMFRG